MSEPTTARIWKITREHAKHTMDHLIGSEKIVHDESTGCWVHHVSTTGTCLYGQAQVKWPVSGVRSRGREGMKYRAPPGFEGMKILVHQLSAFAFKDARPVAGEDVSHLCHNPACANPEHLCIESHAINMDRKACPGSWVTVTVPCAHPDVCTEMHVAVVDMCKHAPKCLQRW